jgi:hypothetical protein
MKRGGAIASGLRYAATSPGLCSGTEPQKTLCLHWGERRVTSNVLEFKALCHLGIQPVRICIEVEPMEVRWTGCEAIQGGCYADAHKMPG